MKIWCNIQVLLYPLIPTTLAREIKVLFLYVLFTDNIAYTIIVLMRALFGEGGDIGMFITLVLKVL